MGSSTGIEPLPIAFKQTLRASPEELSEEAQPRLPFLGHCEAANFFRLGAA